MLEALPVTVIKLDRKLLGIVSRPGDDRHQMCDRNNLIVILCEGQISSAIRGEKREKKNIYTFFFACIYVCMYTSDEKGEKMILNVVVT